MNATLGAYERQWYLAPKIARRLPPQIKTKTKVNRVQMDDKSGKVFHGLTSKQSGQFRYGTFKQNESVSPEV